MVGFKSDETLTANQKLIAGVVSGCTTRFLTQPLDVIKLKTQLQKPRKMNKPRNIFSVARSIFREGGPAAFWRGHNLGQMHTMVAVGSQFYVYELATTYAKNLMESKYRQPTVFACGCIAGSVSTFLVVPLEVIRVRQMVTRNQYKGLFHGAHEVYKSGGLRASFSGLQASLIQMGPAIGISFTVFSATQEYILCKLAKLEKNNEYGRSLHSASHVALASTIAGSISGFTSKTITYPFELAKRRLQIATHQDKEESPGKKTKKLIKCKNLVRCLAEAYKREGFFGLYKGWKVTIYKAQLTSIISFTSYELSCLVMRDLFGVKV